MSDPTGKGKRVAESALTIHKAKQPKLESPDLTFLEDSHLPAAPELAELNPQIHAAVQRADWSPVDRLRSDRGTQSSKPSNRFAHT